MEPIISPWLFYWMNIAEGIATIFCVVALVSGIAGLVTFIIGGVDSEEKLIKIGTRLLVLCVILSLAAVVIPGKKTIIQMVCASQTTENNISIAIKTGKDLKNTLKSDLIEIIQAVTEKTKEETTK